MAHRFFHEGLARQPETKSHMSIMDGDKAIELPIVGGVIKIPDELMDKVVLAPGWVKYVGQVPSNELELAPIEDVDFFHTGKRGGTKAANNRSGSDDKKADDKKQDDKKQDDKKADDAKNA